MMRLGRKGKHWSVPCFSELGLRMWTVNPVKMGGGHIFLCELEKSQGFLEKSDMLRFTFEERSILGRGQSSQRKCVSWWWWWWQWQDNLECIEHESFCFTPESIVTWENQKWSQMALLLEEGAMYRVPPPKATPSAATL